eukprot:TRINITY_DN13864_c0_g1_i1.p1 TRINITY_DN13864_c0_g1~~TRINITY_DN13864_c0_g1_i1.p1  ORF type:complete len:318 (-),score=92.21 TRINITY_DN13864_c0_g1_i1:120-980(-)
MEITNNKKIPDKKFCDDLEIKLSTFIKRTKELKTKLFENCKKMPYGKTITKKNYYSYVTVMLKHFQKLRESVYKIQKPSQMAENQKDEEGNLITNVPLNNENKIKVPDFLDFVPPSYVKGNLKRIKREKCLEDTKKKIEKNSFSSEISFSENDNNFERNNKNININVNNLNNNDNNIVNNVDIGIFSTKENYVKLLGSEAGDSSQDKSNLVDLEKVSEEKSNNDDTLKINNNLFNDNNEIEKENEFKICENSNNLNESVSNSMINNNFINPSVPVSPSKFVPINFF